MRLYSEYWLLVTEFYLFTKCEIQKTSLGVFITNRGEEKFGYKKNII